MYANDLLGYIIMSSGTQTSIPMYADDSVLLASSIEKSLAIDPGGGGELSLEKGIDCGPTAVELGLSQAKIAKKEGLSSHYNCA